MASSNSDKIGEQAAAAPTDSPTTPVAAAKPPATEAEGRVKATRHPRWTRQETLVLIEAKRLVESGEQFSRQKPSAAGLVQQTDPKWELISSVCNRQGVKRGGVQCRKRWGNLLTDFRKIKKWESGAKEETESFWMMRNDKRKEKKLPGFFDSVVYNVLDGGVCTAAAYPLQLVKVGPRLEGAGPGLTCKDQGGDGDDDVEEDSEMAWSSEEENAAETNLNFSAAAFAGSNNGPLKTPVLKETTVMMGTPKTTPFFNLPPSSEKQQPPPYQGSCPPGFQREPMYQEGFKRRRLSPDNCEDDASFNNNMVKVLRRNSNILKAHLGAQNMNYQLAREQQKEQSDSLVAALGKLTDALTKIADKL